MLFPPGELARELVGLSNQADLLQERFNQVFGSGEVGSQLNILPRSECRNKIEELENETGQGAPGLGEVRLVKTRDVYSADDHLAGGRRIQSADYVEKGCLPGTAGAKDYD